LFHTIHAKTSQPGYAQRLIGVAGLQEAPFLLAGHDLVEEAVGVLRFQVVGIPHEPDGTVHAHGWRAADRQMDV
jgi:hypothetical protein